MKSLPARSSRLVLLAFAVGALAASPAVAQQSGPSAPAALSSDVSGDVLLSYQQLATTPYRQVSPQDLLDAARGAIITQAHMNHVRVRLAPIQATDDDRATVSALDQEIEAAAAAAHTSPTDYAYAAINGMAQAVDDRWTVFMDPADFRKFNNVLDPEKIPGIGVMVEADQATKLARAYFVVPGTPAESAGIETGEYFLSVDGTSTKGMDEDAIRKVLSGKAGTVVHILVARTPTDAGRDVSIERAEVRPPTVVYKMLQGNVAYISILTFGRTTPDEFNYAASRVKEQGARALVLDLRNNGGGYVESALKISERFIARKAIMTIEQRGSDNQTFCAHNAATVTPDECMDDDAYQQPDEPLIDLPTTVLVNEHTASASEITAGALQDDGVGSLVGTKTFGKGVMQTLTDLPDGSAIKITTAHYLTPAQHDINLRGIQPNVTVDGGKTDRFGEISSDAQLRAALELLQKKVADVKQ